MYVQIKMSNLLLNFILINLMCEKLFLSFLIFRIAAAAVVIHEEMCQEFRLGKVKLILLNHFLNFQTSSNMWRLVRVTFQTLSLGHIVSSFPYKTSNHSLAHHHSVNERCSEIHSTWWRLKLDTQKTRIECMQKDDVSVASTMRTSRIHFFANPCVWKKLIGGKGQMILERLKPHEKNFRTRRPIDDWLVRTCSTTRSCRWNGFAPL